jgi:hypothetical protein
VRSAFAGSRLLVLSVAAFAAISFPAGIGAAGGRVGHPFRSWPLGGVLDFLLTPFVHWDATWYLRIAEHGYQTHVAALRGGQGFFPVYPLLARALGGFAGAGAATIAAIAISLAAFGLALRLLHRLARLDLGQRGADATVALVAFAPVAFFFSAPYTESLFLLLSVAALLAARSGRWALAGVAAGIASGTRPTGAVLLLPLAILYLYGPRADRGAPERPRGRWAALVPRHRPSPDILWLALAPVGIVAFSLYLRHAVGDAFAWQHVQPLFGRSSTEWPTETVRQGVVAAFHAVKGDGPAVYRGPIMLESVYLLLALAATAGVFRRLPFAYGAYSLGALLVALSSPAYLEPLRALPRYVLPIFPMTMWLAHWTERRGVTRAAVLASAAALAVLTAAFASGQPFV